MEGCRRRHHRTFGDHDPGSEKHDRRADTPPSVDTRAGSGPDADRGCVWDRGAADDAGLLRLEDTDLPVGTKHHRLRRFRPSWCDDTALPGPKMGVVSDVRTVALCLRLRDLDLPAGVDDDRSRRVAGHEKVTWPPAKLSACL